MTERRGRRRKQLLVDLKQMIRYWNLKEITLCGEEVLEGAVDLA